MKRAVAIGFMLVFSFAVLGQQSQPSSLAMGIQILTDKEGVDFNPYVRGLLGELTHNWKEPTGKSGIAVARVQIKPDGTVRAFDPVLERTSGDEAVAQAATTAILKSIPFKPLPAQFHGSYVELRIAFAAKQSLYKPLN